MSKNAERTIYLYADGSVTESRLDCFEPILQYQLTRDAKRKTMGGERPVSAVYRRNGVTLDEIRYAFDRSDIGELERKAVLGELEDAGGIQDQDYAQ
ncbi:hypothetical protein ACFL3V_00230 [Nanoarchaeota archaeon]